MRRCCLLILGTFMLGCADEAPPRIGVTVSVTPGRAADIAADELRPGERGHFEAVVAQLTAPASDAAQAIEQAYAFVNDPRIVAVVGHANSAASLAASQIYNAAGLVQIAPTTTAPVYSQAGPFSFRLVPSDTLQAEYLSKAQRHHWPGSRIAVIHVNDDYGRGLLRVLRPHLEGVVFEAPYADDADSAEVAALADAIAGSRPDLLLWLGRPRTLATVSQQLRAALPDLAIVCADACDVSFVYANRDGQFTGLHFVRFIDPVAEDSAIRDFQRRYRTLTGEPASSEALLTYDAVSLVRAALRDGARSRSDVRAWLESLGSTRPAFEGLTGTIQFDSSGAFGRAYMLAEVRADGVVQAAHAKHRYEH